MKVSAVMLEDELYEATTESNHSVRVDMRPTAVKEGQSPVELLLSALAGCAAVDIVAILKKRQKQVDTLEITVEGQRQETPPRYFTAIHSHYTITSPDVTEEELDKAAGLALNKYCSIGASLKSKLTFSVEVRR